MSERNIEKNKKVFNKWAPYYDSSLFQWGMKKFHNPVFEEIDFSKKPKILDISCGTGELLKAISEKGRSHLFGVDIAEKMLKVARKKLPSTVYLKKADIHQLPFPDNFFDYVISTEAFHHYHNQEIALKEMVRVSKFGGKVIVIDINFFWSPINWLVEKVDPGCEQINSKEEMLIHFRTAKLHHLRQKRAFVFSVATVGRK